MDDTQGVKKDNKFSIAGMGNNKEMLIQSMKGESNLLKSRIPP